jgi:hypothetical protein
MNNASSCKKTTAVVYAIGILGAVAVVGLVVAKVSSAVKAPDLTEARLIDTDRVIYRIPVESAKEIVLREWKNPAAGRKALLERLDKATAKLPEKANPFE